MIWDALYRPEDSFGELFIRGSLIYNALFFLLRMLPRRQMGNLSITDLLLFTLIADASQNGIAGEYRSIAGALFLVATIVLWDYLYDVLAYRSDWFRRLIEPRPTLLIKDGKMLRENMKRELISSAELRAQLREQGISELSLVRKAHIESDGRISVVKSGD